MAAFALHISLCTLAEPCTQRLEVVEARLLEAERELAALQQCPTVPVGTGVCARLRAGCGDGGAPCMKERLERLLPHPGWLAAELELDGASASPEVLFLCMGEADVAQLVSHSGDPAVLGLIERLSGDVPGPAVPAALGAAELRSAYAGCLQRRPDSRYCLDRLAAVLGRAPPGSVASRARSMLLHGAMLRGVIASPHQRPMLLQWGLAAKPVWRGGDVAAPAAMEKWAALLQAPEAVETMAAEAERAYHLLDAERLEQAEGLHTGRWGELHLIVEEKVVRGADARFGQTLSLLAAAGGALNARISLLGPNTHIAPHCGLSNQKLRMHLPLHVPPTASGERTGLRVAGTMLQWTKGEAIVFDDSFEHEAYYRWRGGGGGVSAAPQPWASSRALLMLDMWHPQLSHEAKEVCRRSFRNRRGFWPDFFVADVARVHPGAGPERGVRRVDADTAGGRGQARFVHVGTAAHHPLVPPFAGMFCVRPSPPLAQARRHGHGLLFDAAARIDRDQLYGVRHVPHPAVRRLSLLQPAPALTGGLRLPARQAGLCGSDAGGREADGACVQPWAQHHRCRLAAVPDVRVTLPLSVRPTPRSFTAPPGTWDTR